MAVVVSEEIQSFRPSDKGTLEEQSRVAGFARASGEEDLSICVSLK